MRLGTTAFGGPAAHSALMADEAVRRRGWVTHEKFLDLLGATNLISGPNSTEMAIHRKPLSLQNSSPGPVTITSRERGRWPISAGISPACRPSPPPGVGDKNGRHQSLTISMPDPLMGFLLQRSSPGINTVEKKIDKKIGTLD